MGSLQKPDYFIGFAEDPLKNALTDARTDGRSDGRPAGRRHGSRTFDAGSTTSERSVFIRRKSRFDADLGRLFLGFSDFQMFGVSDFLICSFCFLGGGWFFGFLDFRFSGFWGFR